LGRPLQRPGRHGASVLYRGTKTGLTTFAADCPRTRTLAQLGVGGSFLSQGANHANRSASVRVVADHGATVRGDRGQHVIEAPYRIGPDCLPRFGSDSSGAFCLHSAPVCRIR
jgi:hypothetical protein